MAGEDLAFLVGSHNGEPAHTERARTVLQRIGRGPEDLSCGAHPPLHGPTASTLARSHAEPSPLHHNCSGNHIGMLALAGELGAPSAGYAHRDHPVQREILGNIARFAGLPPEGIVPGIDGCGVPCFGTSLFHLAWAFARLMDPSAIGEPHASAARAVRSAMTDHPYLVAGTGRLDTELMEVGRGSLVVKGGAAGVQCVGFEDGLGVAVKLEDGASAVPGRPAGLAAIEVLRQLGLLDAGQLAALGDHSHPIILDVSQTVVGEARPVFWLRPPGRGLAAESFKKGVAVQQQESR